MSLRIRRGDWASIWLLQAALMLMGAGYLYAQSQESINMVTEVRLSQLVERVKTLETAQAYGLGALVANLLAHIIQIKGAHKGRRDQ